jgi:hypothetical protein
MLLADIKKFAKKRGKRKVPKETRNRNVYGGVGYGHHHTNVGAGGSGEGASAGGDGGGGGE